MPSLYDDLFEDDGIKNKSSKQKLKPIDLDNDPFQEKGQESLDEVLAFIHQFTTKAESFSQLLTNTRAIDHEVEEGVLDFFLITKDKHDQGTLAKERKYYILLQAKFAAVIHPMRDLAQLHLQTVKQFNRDIDSEYYSIEKTDHQVASEKDKATDHISTQRKILADAASSLSILEKALLQTEKRIYQYIDEGGINNISRSEYEILVQKRIAVTNGELHQFEYSFFKMNLLDKTVIAMGGYLKETTTQYLDKLGKVFTY